MLPSLEQCGSSFRSRVRSGNKISHGAHPWLAGVGFPSGKGSFTVLCGGTLITKKHVLTAAHCFVKNDRVRPLAPDLTHVILGEHSLSRSDEREAPVVIKIARRGNPGYVKNRFYDDISLLLLEKEVQFSYYIQPACLPSKEYVENFNYTNSELKFVGWGKTSSGDTGGTDEPMEIHVSLIPKETCKDVYQIFPQIPLDDTQICFGKKDKNFCQGDSGGPLIFVDNKLHFRHFVVGIAAFGAVCGLSVEIPGVYTYIPTYMTWIMDNL